MSTGLIVYLIAVALNVAMVIKMHKGLKEYWDSNSHMAWIYASCLLAGLATIPILVCLSIEADDKREEKRKLVDISEHQNLANQIMGK